MRRIAPNDKPIGIALRLSRMLHAFQDIVLAGAPRWLTRPTFFEREFVAFGAEASAEGVRWEQPRFSVVFAPLAGATEAASEVWVDEVCASSEGSRLGQYKDEDNATATESKSKEAFETLSF